MNSSELTPYAEPYHLPDSMHAFNWKSLHIVGKSGTLGSDLVYLAQREGLELQPDPQEADFIAVCTPSYVSEEIISDSRFADKTVIDLSGAAKTKPESQYSLMTPSGPYNTAFNRAARLFSNPGCIASAVIMGLRAAGFSKDNVPSELSVVSVGGQTHARTVDGDELRVARRMYNHPHVKEIESAFKHRTSVASFTPLMCDIPRGLLIAIHGKSFDSSVVSKNASHLAVSSVVGTPNLQHRLDRSPHLGSNDFTLTVAIDNVRYVTNNAINVLRYISHE